MPSDFKILGEKYANTIIKHQILNTQIYINASRYIEIELKVDI